MVAEPPDEGQEILILPHPGGKAVEQGRTFHARRTAANDSVDRGGVGPIRFRRDDAESVPLDQPPGDRGASAIEFRRAVAGLPQQHDARVREAIEHRAEGRIVDIRQQLGRLANDGRERLASSIDLLFAHGERTNEESARSA